MNNTICPIHNFEVKRKQRAVACHSQLYLSSDCSAPLNLILKERQGELKWNYNFGGTLCVFDCLEGNYYQIENLGWKSIIYLCIFSF